MMKKILHYLIHPKKIILYIMNKGGFKWIPDKIYLKWKYKLNMNKKLDLENPKTFNEKLQWLKLYDRKNEYTKMVDKHLVRNYVEEKIGNEYLIPLLGVYESFKDIDFDSLPNQFVIKPNHTSGDVYICKDKNKINYSKLEKMIQKWLKRKYYYYHREWPYKNVKPKIVIEKYMGDNINDYKFMCFNGEVKCSFVCSDRNSNNGLHVTFFDKDFKKMPFERHYPSSKEDIKKPFNYEKMIELAEIFSKEIPFVRVDFYEIDNKIYFGELTFYPGSGYEEFTPEEYDKILGDWIPISMVRK